jgi:polyribonucleotide nucleotidyltransferase
MASNAEQLAAAVERVLGSTAEAEVGKIYRGKVVTIKDFGAFVEIIPGVEGLLHISEMADYRVNKVTDICSEGQLVTVKVIDIDPASGKVKLSRKAVLKEIDE